ncbi:hypothetical protein Acr_26g0006580 [Actinidia rufa]|uniref:Retrotransposon gag domain-containing protein n=1 Tax=Actinidia rufa TaxID=165716 RepID=A0A7J0H2Z9_9ERIC|nr:hypothetical protein Acr_26g0006580 [Actinidia rufa]
MATTESEVTEHVGVQEKDTLPPIGKGKRSKLADVMASLEARLQRVELAMADNRHKIEDLDQRIDGLEGGHEEFHREMQGILNLLAESWKMAVTQGTISSSHPPKVDIPRPENYNGSRNARKLDNFLWNLDQYFEATVNSEHEARARLRRLFHKSTIREYVKEFSELMLEIPDMTEKESLFTFIDGLQSWAKLEVQRRGPQDLATAISIVDSLVDFQVGESSSSMPKFQMDNHDQGGGNNEGVPKPSSPRQSRFNKDRRAKLAALIRDDEEEPHQEEAKVGSLRLLNAIKAKVGKTKAPRKECMYVEAKVRSFNTRALIDTGASHNFIEVKEAKRLGFQLKEEQGWIKAVNTEARPIYGVVRGVRLHIGDWCGQVDFTMVPMDDYPIVLGMEFLDGFKTLSAMQLSKKETSAKIFAAILTKSLRAFKSAKGWHADMAKVAKDEEIGGQKSASEASQSQAKGLEGGSVGTEQLMSWIQSADDKHSKGEFLQQFVDKIAKLREMATRASPDWVGKNVTSPTKSTQMAQ